MSDSNEADWEASKIKSGVLLKSNARNHSKLPKLNLVQGESLEKEIRKVNEIVTQLKAKKEQNDLELKVLSRKKLNILEKKETASKALQNITTSLGDKL